MISDLSKVKYYSPNTKPKVESLLQEVTAVVRLPNPKLSTVVGLPNPMMNTVVRLPNPKLSTVVQIPIV